MGELELRIPIVDGVPYTGWGTTHRQNRLSSLPPHAIRSIRVECATLDSFSLEKVGFIKIDVEGSELDVLNGAIETVHTWRPIVLVEAEDRHRPAALQTVARFFSSLHYDGWFLEDGRLQKLSRNGDRESADEVSPATSHNNFFFIPEERGPLRQDCEPQEVSLR